MKDGLDRHTKTRLSIKAYHRAMRDVRDAHRAEFEHRLEFRRAEVGLHRGAVDVDLAVESDLEQLRNPRNATGFKRGGKNGAPLSTTRV